MVTAIAAIDKSRGIADDNGIPWDIPQDKQYLTRLTQNPYHLRLPQNG